MTKSRYIIYDGKLDVCVDTKLLDGCLEIALVKPSGKLIAQIYIDNEKYKPETDIHFENDKEYDER